MYLLLSCFVLLLGALSITAQVPSDRALAGLRGNVKSVETATQETDRTGKPAYPVEKQSTDEYDPSGNLVKSIHHVSGGRTVYFMLDGKRVSRYEQIPGAKSITVQVPVSSAEPAPEPARKKGDGRYERRYEYKLDPSGRVTEVVSYNSDGTLHETRRFKYDASGRIASETVSDPKRAVYGDEFLYDAGGIVIGRNAAFYLASGEREVTPFRYSKIKLDAQGNWIYRVTSQGEGKDAEVVSIETRKITYH